MWEAQLQDEADEINVRIKMLNYERKRMKEKPYYYVKAEPERRRGKTEGTEEMNEDQGNELQEFMEKAQRKASRWVGIVCYLIL